MTWIGYFEPGDGVAIVGHGFSLLTPAGRDDAFVHAMADLVDHPNPDPNELSARLVSRDLRTVPPFVLAIASEEDLRVLTRGDIDVVIAEGADLIPVNGRHAHTWLERSFDPGSALHASCGGQELRGRFTVCLGLVPARTIQWFPIPVASAVYASVAGVAGFHPHREAPDPRPALLTSGPAVFPAPISPLLPALKPVLRPGPTEMTIVPPGDSALESLLEAVALADAEIDVEANLLLDTNAPRDKDYLFGVTRATTVEQAAVRVDDDDLAPDRVSEPAIAPKLSPFVGATSSPPTQPPSLPGPPAPAVNPVPELISSAPWMSTPSGRLSAPKGGFAHDHDGRTRSVKDLLDASASSMAASETSAAPDVFDGPVVQCALCPAGHPNPTTASVCWSCDRPVSGANVVSAHRPPLGILVVENDRIPLHRTIILGRQPSADGLFRGDPPHLLSVGNPSSDISRTHAEIRVDGWNLLLKDLGSTNGTWIHLPGRAAERLRSNEAVALATNTSIELARELTIRLEPFR